VGLFSSADQLTWLFEIDGTSGFGKKIASF
jgi:hypothetical protein